MKCPVLCGFNHDGECQQFKRMEECIDYINYKEMEEINGTGQDNKEYSISLEDAVNTVFSFSVCGNKHVKEMHQLVKFMNDQDDIIRQLTNRVQELEK